MAWEVNINTSRDYNGTVTNYAPQIERIEAFRGSQKPFAFAPEPSYIRCIWRQGLAIPDAIQAGMSIELKNGSYTFTGRVRSWRFEVDGSREIFTLEAVGLDDFLRHTSVAMDRDWINLSVLTLAEALLQQVRWPAYLTEGTASYPNHKRAYAGAVLPLALFDAFAEHCDTAQSTGATGRVIGFIGDRWLQGQTSIYAALAELALFDMGRLTVGEKIIFKTGYELQTLKAAAASASFDDTVAEMSRYPYRIENDIHVVVRPRTLGDAGTSVFEINDLRVPAGETLNLRHGFTDAAGDKVGIYYLCPNLTYSAYLRTKLRDEVTNPQLEITITAWDTSGFNLRIYNRTATDYFVSIALTGVPILLGDKLDVTGRSDEDVQLYGVEHEAIGMPFWSEVSNYVEHWRDWWLLQKETVRGAIWRLRRRNPSSYPALLSQVTAASTKLNVASAQYTVIGERWLINQSGAWHDLFLEPTIRTFRCGDTLGSGYPLGFGAKVDAAPFLTENIGEFC